MPQKLDGPQRGQVHPGSIWQDAVGPDRRHESERGHSLSLGGGYRLAPVALKSEWVAKWG